MERLEQRVASRGFLWPFVLIAFGILLRVVQYMSDRSLWLDEAMLANNLLHRTAAGLMKPLDNGQAAALGFLWLEKFAVRIFGPSELSLRLFPFLAGIASILLFYLVAKRTVQRNAMLTALFLFCISEPLIYYSEEVKQYSIDVLMAVFLLWLVSRFKSDRWNLVSGIVWGLAGAVAIWFSHPAVFVFAGITLTLFFSAFSSKNVKSAIHIAAGSVITVASFGVLYWLSLRNIVSNQALRAGHYSNFAPLPLSQDAVRWYYTTLLALFDKPVGLGAPGLATFAMLVGSAYLYVRRRRQAALLIAPIAVALIASGLHRYPFATTANFPYSGGRFVLFAVPGLLLLLAEGVEQLRCLLNKHIPAAGFILIGLIVFSPLAATVEMLRHPIKVEELRPVLEYIRAHQQPRDAIYVYYGAQPAYFYYTDTLRFVSAGPVIKGIEARGEWRQYEHDLDSLRGKGRVWFVFAHNWTGNGINESQWFGYLLDRLGTRADEIHQPGALAYLYDIR